jgi:hypothetical protein
MLRTLQDQHGIILLDSHNWCNHMSLLVNFVEKLDELKYYLYNYQIRVVDTPNYIGDNDVIC